MPQFFFRPARSVDCRAAIFVLAGAIPDCCAAIFLSAGAIRRLPGRNFYFGRRDPRLPRRNFSLGRHDLFAVPYSIWIRCFLRPSPPLLIVARPRRIFKRPVRCPAAIFEEAGVILDCGATIFSFGRRDLSISGPHFFFRPARSLIAAP